jgi:hypothetical protein
MAKSTPGPWTAKGYRVFALEEHPLRIIAYARGLNIKERTPEDEANARLIAAAPSMYLIIEKHARLGDIECIELLEAINGIHGKS